MEIKHSYLPRPHRPWRSFGKLAAATAVLAAIAGAISTGAQAQAPDSVNEQATASMARFGLRIAPVPLDMRGRNPFLVGLGSYIVNAKAGCNDCHSAGPGSQYLAGGNPFFGQRPTVTNPATYLGDGRDFGPLIPDSAHIVWRNLTPDKTGKPGGDTFQDFLEIIRTGADADHLHPTCSSTSSPPCLEQPFDGALLQIMPWPVYQKTTDQDLFAIYLYLSAIPCVEGPGTESTGRCK